MSAEKSEWYEVSDTEWYEIKPGGSIYYHFCTYGEMDCFLSAYVNSNNKDWQGFCNLGRARKITTPKQPKPK